MVRTEKKCTEYERENFRVGIHPRSTSGPENNRLPAVIRENQEGRPTLNPEVEASIQHNEKENSASKLKVGITQKILSDRSLTEAAIDVIDVPESDLKWMNPRIPLRRAEVEEKMREAEEKRKSLSNLIGLTNKRKSKPPNYLQMTEELRSRKKQKLNHKSIPTEKTAYKSVNKSNKQKKHDRGKSTPKVKVVKY